MLVGAGCMGSTSRLWCRRNTRWLWKPSLFAFCLFPDTLLQLQGKNSRSKSRRTAKSAVVLVPIFTHFHLARYQRWCRSCSILHTRFIRKNPWLGEAAEAGIARGRTMCLTGFLKEKLKNNTSHTKHAVLNCGPAGSRQGPLAPTKQKGDLDKI